MCFKNLNIRPRRCPICSDQFKVIPMQLCTIYRCYNKNGLFSFGYLVDGERRRFYHYEFLEFKDNTIGTNFILKPFAVFSDEKYSTLYFIDGEYATDMGYRESPLLLLSNNIDHIKKKIKLLSIFS